jgi:hypothetical protein
MICVAMPRDLEVGLLMCIFFQAITALAPKSGDPLKEEKCPSLFWGVQLGFA